MLASYIREHDPAPTVEYDELPDEPDTDVQAALSVLARRPADPAGAPTLDLHGIRTPNGSLSAANLVGANLNETTLYSAELAGAGLRDSSLRDAGLADANLHTADLRGANLNKADLNLTNLHDANLRGADLSGAKLQDADLRGADLRGVRGISEEKIRQFAKTDNETLFGQLPGA
ncbi:pentapeptide repeat-containing protein [Actinocorallia aurea]